MPDISALFDKADAQIMQADNKEKVFELLRTYEDILEIDPFNFDALWRLGRYYVVLVFAYSDNRDQKGKYNLTAMRYCEQAMNTNPEFRALMQNGENVWDACRVLTAREIAPLYYWYAGLGSYWKECLSRVNRLRKLHWGGGIKKVMIRMLEIDPEWAGGHPLYAWAFYYAIIPRIWGGSLKKSEIYFDKAIQAGPNWLYLRWARAKHLHTRTKDREAFEKDLQWVISQDPRKADSPYPANVYFQKDAREMLENRDTYF